LLPKTDAALAGRWNATSGRIRPRKEIDGAKAKRESRRGRCAVATQTRSRPEVAIHLDPSMQSQQKRLPGSAALGGLHWHEARVDFWSLATQHPPRCGQGDFVLAPAGRTARMPA
jgi:hypothetical protein